MANPNKPKLEDYVTSEQYEKALNAYHKGDLDSEDEGTLDLVDMFEEGAWEDGLDKFWGEKNEL